MANSENTKPIYGSTVPNDWRVGHLEDLCVKKGLVRGPFGGALKKEFFVLDGYKVYEQKNAIYRDAELGQYFVDEKKFQELKRFKVSAKEFIVSCSGTIGRIFQIPKDAKPGIINQALLKIKTDDNVVNDQFFYHYFAWDKFQSVIIDNTQGGAMQNLVSMDIFRKSKIALPPLPEQNTIAQVLGLIDSAINKNNQLIAQKERRKKWLMQNLLTGKKRLKGFSGEWKEFTLAQIGEFSKGQGILKEQVQTHGLPCIRYGEIYTVHHVIVQKFHSFISQAVADGSREIKSGDILFAGSGETLEEIGKSVAYVGDAQAYAGGDVIILSTDKSVSTEFLAYFLATDYFGRQKRRYGQGQSVVHIYRSDLAKLIVRLPTLEEQTAIAQVLQAADKEIQLLKAKSEKLREQKKGMMQQLLTGKKRLKIEGV